MTRKNFGKSIKATFGKSINATFGKSIKATFGKSIKATFGKSINATFGKSINATFGKSIKIRRNKRKTLCKNKNGGMFRQSIKKVGSLTGSLIQEVGKSKAQDLFKDQVKSWENNKWENSYENKENAINVSVQRMPKMEI